MDTGARDGDQKAKNSSNDPFKGGLSEEQSRELQEKLRDAQKNAHVSQQKVNELHHFVNNLRGTRARYMESLDRRRREMKEKNEEIANLQAEFDKCVERLTERKSRARKIRKEIRNAERAFSDTIKMTRSVTNLASYGCKEIQTNHTSAEMAAERGYDCKPGSTYGHLAKTMSRSFF